MNLTLRLTFLFVSNVVIFGVYGQKTDTILFDYSITNQFIEFKQFDKFSIDSWTFDMDSSDYYGNHTPFGCTAPIKTSISFKNLCQKITNSSCDLTSQINPYWRTWKKSELNYKIQKHDIFTKWWNHYIQDILNLFRSKNTINIGQAVKINDSNYLIQYYITNRHNRLTQDPKLAHIKTNGNRIIEIKEY